MGEINTMSSISFKITWEERGKWRIWMIKNGHTLIRVKAQ